jgi:hypothetical protein
MKQRKYSIHSLFLYAFLIYAFFYLLLFVQFPLNNSIAGSLDTWMAVALSNYIPGFFSSIFTGTHFTTSMFPTDNVLQWGESATGCLMLLNFYKLFGCSDITSWYFYIVTIFALNGSAVFLLSYYYNKNFLAAIIAGFFFTCSNFVFVNIDDAHILFYFLPILSVYFLLNYKDSQKTIFMYFATILISIQIYVALYVFAFGSLICAIILIYSFNNFKNIDRRKILLLVKCFIIYLLIIAPFILFYLHTSMRPDFYNHPWIKGSMATLNVAKLFQVMPNNLLYNSSHHEYELMWTYWPVRGAAFIGSLFMVTSLFCVIKYFRQQSIWILVICAGIICSSVVYEYLCNIFPLLLVLRAPYRAYVIVILAFSVIASIGIGDFLKKFSFKKQLIITVVILSIHFTENIPNPFPLVNIDNARTELLAYKNITVGDGFSSSNLIPNDTLLSAINKIDKNSVILCLPSSRIFGEGPARWLSYSREMLYMNHQTYFKRNIFNGVNGYFPKSRLLIQKNIDELPKDDALGQLINSGMTHLLFYKNMVLIKEENILDSLRQTKMLYLISETSDFALFGVAKTKLL